jgi:hypothetical protein
VIFGNGTAWNAQLQTRAGYCLRGKDGGEEPDRVRVRQPETVPGCERGRQLLGSSPDPFPSSRLRRAWTPRREAAAHACVQRVVAENPTRRHGQSLSFSASSVQYRSGSFGLISTRPMTIREAYGRSARLVTPLTWGHSRARCTHGRREHRGSAPPCTDRRAHPALARGRSPKPHEPPSTIHDESRPSSSRTQRSKLGSTGFSILTSGTGAPPVESSTRSSGRNPFAV